MAEIVWAACVSHTGAMLRFREEAEADASTGPIYPAWEELRASLAASEPDVLIAVGSDHFHNQSYDLMPIFTIGRGDRFRTWGEFGSRQIQVAGAPDLSDRLHDGLVEAGYDVAGSVEMRLDHAWACPLEFLDPENRIPVVPVAITSFIPPLPSMSRCLDLGYSLRDLLDREPDDLRVALVGTGGISHWIGMPETGKIGEEFDRDFLALVEAASLAELAQLDDEAIVSGGGPGAGELRCWMTVLGAARATAARPLVYVPSPKLMTGVALVEVTCG